MSIYLNPERSTSSLGSATNQQRIQANPSFLQSSLNQQADAHSNGCCSGILTCLKGILDWILKFLGCGEKSKKEEIPKDNQKKEHPVLTVPQFREEEKEIPVPSVPQFREEEKGPSRSDLDWEIVNQAIQKGTVTEFIFLKIIDHYVQPGWNKIFDEALRKNPSNEVIKAGFIRALALLHVRDRNTFPKILSQLYTFKPDLNAIFKKEPEFISKMIRWMDNLGSELQYFFFSKECCQALKDAALKAAILLEMQDKKYLNVASQLITSGADQNTKVDRGGQEMTAGQWLRILLPS